MSTILFVQIVGLVVIGYISIHGIVNRICKCAENCAAFKSFGPTAINDPNAFKEALTKLQEKK